MRTPNIFAGLLPFVAAALLLHGCATIGGGTPAMPPPQPGLPGPAPTAPVETPPSQPPQTGPAPTVPPVAPVEALPLPYPSDKDSRALLLRLLPPKIADRAGWAGDIVSAFAALGLPPNAPNFCATIAVIEQESGFQADPVVPGLAAIVWREIETRRKKYGIPKLVVDTALLKTSPDGRSYRARIDALKTEKQMNTLFEDMISELPNGRQLLSGYNPVRTGGPMQVSVDFAAAQSREKRYPYPMTDGSLRHEVFSRRGGLYFGIADLLDYPTPYTRAVYRFADYNAGRYSSRNAAFQQAVSRLAGRRLDYDGDLLRYRDGLPTADVSSTQGAILPLARHLGLGEAEIRRDLKLEKSAAFEQTPLYQRLFALADRTGVSPAPREILPRIDLKSPKIHRRLTTGWFADRVDLRYRNCLARDTGLPAALTTVP